MHEQCQVEVTSDNTIGISTHLHYNCSTKSCGIRVSSSGVTPAVCCIMCNYKDVIRPYTTFIISKAVTRLDPVKIVYRRITSSLLCIRTLFRRGLHWASLHYSQASELASCKLAWPLTRMNEKTGKSAASSFGILGDELKNYSVLSQATYWLYYSERI